MRARHFFLALLLCALPHVAAVNVSAVATATAAPPPAFTADGTDTDGCEVSYSGGEVAGAPDYHVPVPSVAVPPPLDLKEQLALDEQSYVDVYSILKVDNECSRFFGGPAQAVEAFNELARSLKRKPLGNRAVGVRMSGGFVTYRNHQTGATYRLFEEATVNTDGPLFRKTAAHERDARQSRVGKYRSRTRPANALVFLHELGHLVARAAGGWALPNDGDNRELSERNTKTVEENCGQQLTALGE